MNLGPLKLSDIKGRDILMILALLSGGYGGGSHLLNGGDNPADPELLARIAVLEERSREHSEKIKQIQEILIDLRSRLLERPR